MRILGGHRQEEAHQRGALALLDELPTDKEMLRYILHPFGHVFFLARSLPLTRKTRRVLCIVRDAYKRATPLFEVMGSFEFGAVSRAQGSNSRRDASAAGLACGERSSTVDL